ncbi:MAG: SDR family NAD(P)-dependent oxidoreductase [Pseudomonadota bacterium]
MTQTALHDRRVLVTGGSGGIGQAICRRLAADGASIVVHYYRNETEAQALAAELTDAATRAVAIQADLRGEDGPRQLIKEAAAQLGPLNALINNAAVQPIASFGAISSDEVTQMLTTNLGGPFQLIQRFAAQVSADARASVVNIASIEGLRPARDHSHYAASKAALIMLTRAAALELGKSGIRVNSVSPGLIDRVGLETDWPDGVARWKKNVPAGRLGTPHDVANACAFLISGEAAFINAHNLVVDGGMQATPGW